MPSRVFGLLPLLALLALWQAASWAQIYPTLLLPPPAKVATAFVTEYPDIFRNAVASITRVIVGVSLAFCFAVPLGLLIGRYQILDVLADWSIQMFRSVPPISLIPMALLFFGIGDKPAIVLIFLAATWPLLINTIFGVRTVDQRLFEAASMLGCHGTAQFFRVVLPASLPAIFTGLRLGLGFAWVVIVVGEMTGVQTGLGAIIMEARQLSRTEIVICGMVVIGVAGFISDRFVVFLGRRLLRWSPSFA